MTTPHYTSTHLVHRPSDKTGYATLLRIANDRLHTLSKFMKATPGGGSEKGLPADR